MKFKSTLLTATMFAAGALVTAPAFAGTTSAAAAANSQVAQMEAVMTQNQTALKGVDSAFTKDWFQKITISGQANIDATYSSHGYSSSDTIIGSNSASQLVLNNANVYVDAPLNDWSSAHMAFVYGQDRDNSTAVPRLYAGQGASDFNIDEAYVAFRNFNVSPMYLVAGKQYVNFGTYHHFPMFDSLTQLMTETKATAVTLGAVTAQGVSGSVYTFNGPKDSDHSPTRTNVRDWGVRLGYAGEMSGVNYGATLGYIRNVGAATYINNRLATSGETASDVGAWNIHLQGATGPFYANANYVAALQSFKNTDLDYGGTCAAGSCSDGAKPWAYNLHVGYHFDTVGHKSSVELGFGQTGEASGSADTAISTRNAGGLYLPKTRWMAVYNVNVLKNTDIGFGLLNDKDYSKANGGSGRTTTTGTVRLSVQFA